MKTCFRLVYLCFAATAALIAEETIVTVDGKSYPDATVVEMTQSAARIRYGIKYAVIPFRKLPASIRERYSYDVEELQRLMKAGVPGVYREDHNILSSREITLQKDGKFSMQWTTDAGGPLKPMVGTYTISDQWLKLEYPARGYEERAFVFAVVDGKLALMTGREYVKWKDRDIGLTEILYRHEPE